MMGLLASLAASRAATTVDEEVTLIAGMANPAYIREVSRGLSPTNNDQFEVRW